MARMISGWIAGVNIMGIHNFEAAKFEQGHLICFGALRIQVCPKKGINPIQSYCGDGIGTINPSLARGLDA